MYYAVRNHSLEKIHFVGQLALGVAVLIYSVTQKSFIGMALGLLLILSAPRSNTVHVDHEGVKRVKQFLFTQKTEGILFKSMLAMGVEQTARNTVQVKFVGDKRRMEVIFSKEDVEDIMDLAQEANTRLVISDMPEQRRSFFSH